MKLFCFRYQLLHNELSPNFGLKEQPFYQLSGLCALAGLSWEVLLLCMTINSWDCNELQCPLSRNIKDGILTRLAHNPVSSLEVYTLGLLVHPWSLRKSSQNFLLYPQLLLRIDRRNGLTRIIPALFVILLSLTPAVMELSVPFAYCLVTGSAQSSKLAVLKCDYENKVICFVLHFAFGD